MSSEAAGLVGFFAMLLLIGLRVPVAIAMGTVGLVGGWYLNGWASVTFILGSAPFETVFPYGLSVIPLFVMMGVFAAHAGMSQSLYRAIHALIGHYRGGLANATIGACAAFGAICGSSLATAATMCRVALPEMRRNGYADSLAAATIAAGGTLGILIPPSVVMVVYALLTEQSIGKMFAAGLLPGLLATLLYMGAVLVQLRLRPDLAPPSPRPERAARLVAYREVWPVALLFVLVMGGIYVGWFSPTEAAAIGAFGTFVHAAARRRLSLRVLGTCLGETATTTAMIFAILIGTAIFNYFVETTGLPRLLIAEAEALGWNRYAVLLLVILFYLALGCFMDSLSMVFITVPFVFPLVTAMGFDPIWFGVLLVCVVEIGLITPPVGMNLFVIVGISGDLRLQTAIRGIVPFILADALRILILVAFPAISLFLPSLMD
ncbi:MAG: TRAP transporter large permease [Alphaproteobacteria bacterium]|nr:TRAP transporter large permease [Alphaproteobacteria bacterium]